MRSFVDRWYGDAPPQSARGGEERAPPPLRALYALTAARDVCSQNRLVPPGDLAVEDDKLTFYVENQGVFRWATEPRGDDPPVYVRGSAWGAPWQKESGSLSAFLLQLLVLEATFAAPFGASHDALSPRALSSLEKRVRPLPLPPWASSGTRFYGSGGVIGFATPQGKERSIWLGAKDIARLDPLSSMLSRWPDVRT